ncbi:hypothetical protein SAMN05444172_5429 [Burkholderia sp. GAS332]|nr:hypothetical protein SAMN05444172_5429 [Burkholderia sp. GAS332]
MNANWQAAAAIITALGILTNAWTAWRLQQDTSRQKRRSDLIPVWKEMLAISRIDSLKPDPEQVRIALNLLALISQCYALDIVEKNVLKEIFGSVFVSVYKDIAAINNPITIGVTTQPGRDFLNDEKRIANLYNQWSTS